MWPDWLAISTSHTKLEDSDIRYRQPGTFESNGNSSSNSILLSLLTSTFIELQPNA